MQRQQRQDTSYVLPKIIAFVYSMYKLEHFVSFRLIENFILYKMSPFEMFRESSGSRDIYVKRGRISQFIRN